MVNLQVAAQKLYLGLCGTVTGLPDKTQSIASRISLNTMKQNLWVRWKTSTNKSRKNIWRKSQPVIDWVLNFCAINLHNYEHKTLTCPWLECYYGVEIHQIDHGRLIQRVSAHPVHKQNPPFCESWNWHASTKIDYSGSKELTYILIHNPQAQSTIHDQRHNLQKIQTDNRFI